MGILDDYFDGYYSEEMLESQVMLVTLSFWYVSLCMYVCVFSYSGLSCDTARN